MDDNIATVRKMTDDVTEGRISLAYTTGLIEGRKQGRNSVIYCIFGMFLGTALTGAFISLVFAP